MTSEEAIAVARDSAVEAPKDETFDGSTGLAREQSVAVRALDYGRDPVMGQLVRLLPNEIAIVRKDERAGVVFVHFPRIGYEVRAA